MNKLVFAGQGGGLYWSYLQAAVLGSWTITDDRLTAQVVSHEESMTTQTSLTFRVDRPHSTPWVWSVAELHIAGGTLTARLQEPVTT